MKLIDLQLKDIEEKNRLPEVFSIIDHFWVGPKIRERLFKNLGQYHQLKTTVDELITIRGISSTVGR